MFKIFHRWANRRVSVCDEIVELLCLVKTQNGYAFRNPPCRDGKKVFMNSLYFEVIA